MLLNRFSLGVCALSVALLTPLTSAHAQNARSVPLKLVVPYSAGGSTDAIARALQKQLTEVMQRSVVVENRPGGAGTIGTDYVAKAAPDGNTIVFGNQAPNAIVPMVRKTPYDPHKDLTPLTTVAFVPLALVVSASTGANSLKEYLAGARKPGANWNYGSSGTASFAHLAGWELAREAKLKMEHIPYKGGSEVVTALMAGDIQGGFISPMESKALVQSGKIKLLAVTSSKRMPILPQTPTIDEEIPGYSAVLWFAVFAPKGTPENVAKPLREALIKAIERQEFKDYLTAHGAEGRVSTPQELTDLVSKDMKFWGGVVRSANIRMD